jgi:hypothetical protein
MSDQTPFSDHITFGEKYEPAMAITDPADAAAWFERCVEHTMRMRPCDRAEAEHVERINLGYWSGYYGIETQARVERLYRCHHPIFGPITNAASEGAA